MTLSENAISPSRQTAVIIQEDGDIGISKNVEIPTILSDQVLVSVKAVSQNPCDWKMSTKYPTSGAIVGCDFAGEIVQVGSDPSVTQRFKVGDRVCGGVHGCNPLNLLGGAFAEYVSAYADILIAIPEDMSWSDAAALGGTSTATLGLALWDHGLKLPGTPMNPVTKKIPVLVHGGSTATGTMALQLLKLSGFHTLATCGAKNFDLVKSYGADEVFDYRSPTCAEDIKKSTRNSLYYVLDVITEATTVELCYAAIGRGGGRYIGLEKLPLNCNSRPTVKADWTLGITIFGEKIALDDGYERDANPTHRTTGRDFFLLVEELVREKKLRPHPVKVLPGGWKGVVDAIDMKRKNQVSGEKLVVMLPEKA